MDRPDPNGCGACGLATCELHLLLAEVGRTGKMPEQAAIDAARAECQRRPPVDWQAECRRRPPPEATPTTIRLCADDVLELAAGAILETGDLIIEGAPERECMCGTAPTPHEYGCEGCEYHDHHCETCHRVGNCTAAACGFPQRPSTRPRLVQLPPEVLAAAAELRRPASEIAAERDALVRAEVAASSEWAQHMRLCAPCRAWAEAQRKAPPDVVVAVEHCSTERRLAATMRAAQAALVEAQEKRAALPLVLVAWIEGLAGGGA